MIHRGLEPRTTWLKVKCSTAWASGPYLVVCVTLIGWGGRIWTYEYRNQNPVPYRLATPQRFNGAKDGNRTHDLQDHNLALHRLSYFRHISFSCGTPEGTRTPDTRLRRAVLYPAELLAHIGLLHPSICANWQKVERVMGIGPTQPAWKAGVLPLNYTRTSFTMLNDYIKTNFYCQLNLTRF